MTMKDRLRRSVKGLIYHGILPRVYRRACNAPVREDRVLFVNDRGDTLADSFLELKETLESRYTFDIKVFDQHREAGQMAYARNGAELLREMARSRYVFLSDANEVVSCVAKRPETVVTQLWHACGAFKRFGMSTVGILHGADGDNVRKFPYYANLNYVTVSSPEVIPAYTEAMDLKNRPTQVLPLGVSRTDRFFKADVEREAREKLLARFPEARGKKVMLYAPTFRGKPSAPKAPEALPLEELARSCGEDWTLVIKHHPFVTQRPAVPESLAGFAKDLTEEMTIEELLICSDLCISDYSSLIFEYALLDRPMLFYAYDKEDYDDWRGFYYDYDRMTPGPVCRTAQELVQHAADPGSWFDPEQIRKFREEFMSACDGHSTQRIMEQVFTPEVLDRYRRTQI